jgi:hypothetical protein
MKKRFASLAVIMGLAAAPASAQNSVPYAVSDICATQACLSVVQNGTKVRLFPNPILGLDRSRGLTTYAVVQLPQGAKGVDFIIANATEVPGEVCAAVRNTEGKLVAIPSGLPVEEESSRDPYRIVDAFTYADWPEGSCERIGAARYVFLGHVMREGKRRKIDISALPNTANTGRPAVVVAFFPAINPGGTLRLSTPEAVMSILTGDVYAPILRQR